MSTKKKFGIKNLEKRLGKMTVGGFLLSWRKSEELSQKDFAVIIGMSAANLCDIEKGRKGVSPEKADAIAKTLGYPPSILVTLSIQEQLASAGLKYKIDIKAA